MPTFLALTKRPLDASLIGLAINVFLVPIWDLAHCIARPVLPSTVSALYIELHR